MWRRRYTVNPATSGTSSAITSASRHCSVNITISEPVSVITEMNRSSGPWCASSTTSNRSPTTRLISEPVRCVS